MASTGSTMMNISTDSLWNRSVEPLEDLNARYSSRLVPFAVLLGLFSATGVIGNILVIAVFTTRQYYKHTTFRIFVICLAIIDLLSCLTLIPTEIFKTRNCFTFPNTPCKVKCFFNVFSTSTAAFTLLIICIERFRKVCQPLRKQIGPDLAMKLLLVILAVAFVISIPAPIMCGSSKENKTNIYNTTTVVYMCSAEEKYKMSIYRTLYKFGLAFVVLCVSFALIIMYILIMRTVIRHWGEWLPSESVQFKRKQSDEGTDRVEIDRLTDNVSLQEEVKALAQNTGTTAGNCSHGNKQEAYENSPLTASYEKKGNGLRKVSSTSSTSLSSTSVKHKNLVRQISNQRRDSESSFRAHSVRRRSSSTRDGKVPYKTLIWVVLTVVFIVTYFLYAVLAFMSSKQYRMSPGMLSLYSVFFRLYFINHVINPFVYMFLDKRFKSSCLAMIIGFCRKLGLRCWKR